MSNKPTHTAYVVTELKEGSDRKAQWHPVGAVWPHRNGIGFDLVIPAGISVGGRASNARTNNPESHAMAPSNHPAGLFSRAAIARRLVFNDTGPWALRAVGRHAGGSWARLRSRRVPRPPTR